MSSLKHKRTQIHIHFTRFRALKIKHNVAKLCGMKTHCEISSIKTPHMIRRSQKQEVLVPKNSHFDRTRKSSSKNGVF